MTILDSRESDRAVGGMFDLPSGQRRLTMAYS